MATWVARKWYMILVFDTRDNCFTIFLKNKQQLLVLRMALQIAYQQKRVNISTDDVYSLYISAGILLII